MRRRHLLALLILTLVVLTVFIAGPARVWDWMTLFTGRTEYYESGELRSRSWVRAWSLWNPEIDWDDVVVYETRWRNGQLREWSRAEPPAWLVAWTPEGQILAAMTFDGDLAGAPLSGVQSFWDEGVMHNIDADAPDFVSPPIAKQWRFADGELVEERTAPPWFTDEEMLQSVEELSSDTSWWETSEHEVEE